MQVFSDTTEPVQRGHWSQAPWLLRPPQHQKAQWPKGLLAGLGDIGHGAWHNLPRDRILPPPSGPSCGTLSGSSPRLQKGGRGRNPTESPAALCVALRVSLPRTDDLWAGCSFSRGPGTHTSLEFLRWASRPHSFLGARGAQGTLLPLLHWARAAPAHRRARGRAATCLAWPPGPQTAGLGWAEQVRCGCSWL